MNKSTLKEVIQNVVAHKLAEAKGQAPKYGYIISGKKSDDPQLQLIGYGNMPKSYWQRKLEGYADELMKRIKAGDWNAASYFMKESSVFNLAVNMMKEIYDNDLKEISTTQTSTGDNSNKPTTPAEKRLQAAIEKRSRIENARNANEKQQAAIDSREQNNKIKVMRNRTRIAQQLGKATEDVLNAQQELNAQSKKINTTLNESK